MLGQPVVGEALLAVRAACADGADHVYGGVAVFAGDIAGSLDEHAAEASVLGVLATLVQTGNASVYVHLADHGFAGIDRQVGGVCVDVVGVRHGQAQEACDAVAGSDPLQEHFVGVRRLVGDFRK